MKSRPFGRPVASAKNAQIVDRYRSLLGLADTEELELLRRKSRHVIFTRPTSRGRSEVWYETSAQVLLVSRQPLLDMARLLLSLGCSADDC
jgi:hypothetical protein